MPKATVDLDQLVRELATRSKYRTEADVQSRVRDLLLYGGLNVADDELDVQLEAQAGSGLRIDVEVGSTVIEVKKDLTKGGANTLADWERQVAGYLRRRTDERGQRYVGILTDGCVWWLYNLHPDGTISRVGEHVVRPAAPNIDALRTWLEAVLATVDAIKPTPREISRRLGVASPGHALDSASLTDLWKAAKAASPEARLKRELWAKLLRTAFGEHFTDDDELFVEHTYLVLAAEVVAHAVLNIPVEHLSAQAILSGQEFSQRGVHGVVEADFFDWVLQVEGGERFVGDLGRRLSRFDWSAVEHDVLKHLYESVIDEQQRHRLGEYYTPDWLAEKIVADVVDDPLNQRTLDPACGSGTFVFHAVRRFLDAADAAGKTNRDAIRLATSQVLGVDVHPVAVTLARVTYLLALGTKRLDDERDAFGVPIYLGDTMQWDVALGTLGDEGGLKIPTEPAGVLFGAEVLSFPEVVLDPPGAFDSLVLALADRATTDRAAGSKPPRIKGLLDAHKVPEDARATIVDTFAHLCSLHDNNRDHIWAYYARNLARPLWLARPGGRVDRLVGNPPWLSYRFMTPRIQQLFRERSTEHGLWAGSAVATHQDLSGYFVVRSVDRYLKPGGKFGFVMPLAALSRQAFAGFRSGSWGPVKAAFTGSWDLDKVRPHLFPVPSSVVLGGGRPADGQAQALPLAEVWVGQLPKGPGPHSWAGVEPALARTSGSAAGPGISTTGTYASPYHPRFTQGATVVPRVLHVVKEAPQVGNLGLPTGVRRVVSSRTTLEKQPWKSLPDRGPTSIEAGFVRPLYSGSRVAPYRLLQPDLVVIPHNGETLMDGGDSKLDEYPLLASWWREGERLWLKHRSPTTTTPLREWVDYQHKLSGQLPTPATRLVYTSAGNTLAASVLLDTRAVVNSDLYWTGCSNLSEARYLAAVLNSLVVTERVQPLQSKGLFGPRHFHKHVWRLPIPLFEGSNPLHVDIAELAEQADKEAALVDIEGTGFQAARSLIRKRLVATNVAPQLNVLVTQLLDHKP